MRWFAAALAMLAFGVTYAHESRPLYVEVSELDASRFAVRWRTPPSVPEFNLPEVVLSGCEAAGTAPTPAPVGRRLYACDGPEELAVDVRYPLMNPSVATLVRFHRGNGESHSLLAGAEERSIALPDETSLSGVATEYFALGVDHIWKGYDHLLFVACLLLIAGGPRRVLVTITGFTAAHSVTLALAALGWVRLPVPPVEATIALSIVFLARELVRDRRDTLTWRYPIAVSASFGLLHGFGFASVLGEIGLPQTEIPAALLLFNVGVEAGQVAFVAAVICLFAVSRRLVKTLSPDVMHRPVGYVAGTLAAAWLCQRVVGFWGA